MHPILSLQVTVDQEFPMMGIVLLFLFIRKY